MTAIASINPGLILILGALPIPLLPQAIRRLYLLALPALGFAAVYQLEPGTLITMEAFGLTLELLQVDRLSLVWGYIFNIAAFLGFLFAWHDRDAVQQISAMIYAGAAIAAVFAGDLVTLFIYWELTGISSVFLIWASRTDAAYRCGMRYLLIQVSSGVILLSGTVAWYMLTGSIDFTHIGIDSLAGKLILLAFGIKCAFPLLHNWLQDSYPEATVTGTVILSAFTTKLAVYALARGFAGTEVLIYIGAVMAVFPVFYALIENDLRRLLAYALNNQLGFMVVGVGVGTELALNGTAAQAFSHILYKGLLFMTMGAVLFRTGTCKASELGGLFKSMPLTAGFCIIGAASMAFPLFAGFVSKSMIITAVAVEHHSVIWGTLLFASVGVFLTCGLKLPYFTFFGQDSGHRVKEAPWNMLAAMGLTAFLCVFIGCYPAVLYDILPYPVDYKPYTSYHVIQQLQIMMFTALAFVILLTFRIYPMDRKSINLDTDWVYRKAGPWAAKRLLGALGAMGSSIESALTQATTNTITVIKRHHGPEGMMAKTLHLSSMVVWVVAFLAFILLMDFVRGL